MDLVLAGAGGYGAGYVKYLLREENRDLHLSGIVEPYLENCPVREDIERAGVPVFPTLEAFYQARRADLALIVTPTFHHRAHALCALSHGSWALCEKPAAPTAADARAMMEAEKQYGKFIAIGYQWSYSQSMQKVKQEILSGEWGKPVKLKTLICWPRNRAYYARGGGWGGRIQKDGAMILDSIASNACAHYLHNMLFLLGDAMETSARARTIQAQCLRANEIENFDTCVLKLQTEGGAELYFAATHASYGNHNPRFVYEFEKGTLFFDQDAGGRITARFTDGREKDYGSPFESEHGKIRACVQALRSGARPVCTVETALPHVEAVEEIYRRTDIRNFSENRKKEADGRVYVEGLEEDMLRAYEEERFLREE